MKTTILSAIGLVCLVVFFDAAFSQTPEKVITDQIISRFFAEKNQWSNPKCFPDTNVKFVGKLPHCCGKEENKTTTNYAVVNCGESPAYISYMLYMKFDPDANWNDNSCNYNESMRNKFKKISGGKDIIKSRYPTADSAEYEKIKPELRFYNSEAILAGFNHIYRKPKEKFNGIPLQKIYNISLKNYVRESTDIVIKILANKAKFERLANEYFKKAKKDKDFDGVFFSEEATTKILDCEANDFPCLGEYHSRIVSIMLRRQIDGTLPAVLSCLKKILKDYDPTYYSKISRIF